MHVARSGSTRSQTIRSRPDAAFEVQLARARSSAASSCVLAVLALWAVVRRGAARAAPGLPARRAARRARSSSSSTTREADRAARRHRRSPRADARLLGRRPRDRRRSRTTSRIPADDRRALCARRSATARRRSERDLVDASCPARDGSYVRRCARRSRREQAERVAALKLPGITLMAETAALLPERSSWPRTCSVRRRRQRRPRRASSTPTTSMVRGQTAACSSRSTRDGKRHADARRAARPSPGATLELTIDLRPAAHRSSASCEAGVREQPRATGGTAIVMDPQTGEILALANYPTFNPERRSAAPSDDERRNRARSGRLRARLDVQDRHRVGGARRRRRSGRPISSTAIPAYITLPGRKPITEADGHNYGVLSFEDVIVKSSNVGAIKAGLRVGAERLSAVRPAVRIRRSARAGLRGRESRASSIDRPAERQRARVGVDGLPGRRHAAADGGGRERRRQRRHARSSRTSCAAIVRDGVREAGRAEGAAARDRAGDGRDADDDHGRRRRARHGEGRAARSAIRSPARPARRRSSSTGGYSTPTTTRRSSASCRRAGPAFTILVVIDTPRAGRPLRRRRRGADLQAHRRGGAAPDRRAADDQSGAADRRHGEPTSRCRCTPRGAPTVIPALTPVGGRALMPDVRGLSGARGGARARRGRAWRSRLRGSTASSSTQTPEPGEPIEPGDVERARSCDARPDASSRPEARAMTLGALVAAARTLAPDARARVERAGRADAPRDRRRARLARGVAPARSSSPFAASAPTARRSPPTPIARGAVAIVAETPAPAERRRAVAAHDRRAARARRAGGDLLRPSERASSPSSASPARTARRRRRTCWRRCSTRRAAVRPARHGDVPRRARRRPTSATPRTRRPRRRRCSGCCARWSTRGCKACAMEVSSHALVLHRVANVRFAAGDLHEPHARPSRLPRRHAAVLRRQAAAVRDAAGRRARRSSTSTIRAASSWRRRVPRVVTYAHRSARRRARAGDPRRRSKGSRSRSRRRAGAVAIRSPLVGRPNVYNILGVVATAIALDLPTPRDRAGHRRASSACPGRFQIVSGSDRRRARRRRLRAHRRRAEEPARDGAAARAGPARSPCSAAAAIAIARSGR